MYGYPSIEVQIQHDFFDLLTLVVNLMLGIAALISLWISRRALKKSEWFSNMSTSPSIIIRPESIYVGLRTEEEHSAYIVRDPGDIIKKEFHPFELGFFIEFKCINAGRGVAFNVSQVEVQGADLSSYGERKTPLYLSNNEKEYIRFTVEVKKKFDDFCKNSSDLIPISVILTYTNDQGNIFCRSTWKANIKPFDQEGSDLRIRDTRLLQRSGRIEYAEVPFKFGMENLG